MVAADEITLTGIQAARERIRPYFRRTELIASHTLSQRLGAHVYLKLEVFQKTGSFKVRGAFNKLLTLPTGTRHNGVVAVSGGNHAQAVAYAAVKLGRRSVILMPESTPGNYVDATRGYGAEVILTRDVHEAFARVADYESQGFVNVHPFDDPLVIAGAGTLGLEILEDLPQVTDVVVSIGGGGLMTGVATALKSQKPQIRLWGVETEGADAMAQALAAGHIVRLPAITSAARTLGAPAVTELTLAMARKHLESVTVVSDAEAIAALKILLERAKILTELAASCTLAAADRLRPNFAPDSHVVLILCGGNLAVEDLCRYNA